TPGAAGRRIDDRCVFHSTCTSTSVLGTSVVKVFVNHVAPSASTSIADSATGAVTSRRIATCASVIATRAYAPGPAARPKLQLAVVPLAVASPSTTVPGCTTVPLIATGATGAPGVAHGKNVDSTSMAVPNSMPMSTPPSPSHTATSS